MLVGNAAKAVRKSRWASEGRSVATHKLNKIAAYRMGTAALAVRGKRCRGREPRGLLISSYHNESIRSKNVGASRGRSVATHTLVQFAAHKWNESSIAGSDV